MRIEEVIEFMHLTHPRTIFVKSLRQRAVLLDMGAGNGSLQVFRTWLRPTRTDIRIYAYAMERGQAFDAYDRYEPRRVAGQEAGFRRRAVRRHLDIALHRTHSGCARGREMGPLAA